MGGKVKVIYLTEYYINAVNDESTPVTRNNAIYFWREMHFYIHSKREQCNTLAYTHSQ